MKLGKFGNPSLLQGTERSSSEMDKGVVVCEDLEHGAHKIVAKLLRDWRDFSVTAHLRVRSSSFMLE